MFCLIMTLVEVVKNSFREYFGNFNGLIKIAFTFLALPTLIVTLIGYALGGYNFYLDSTDALSSSGQWIYLAFSLIASLIGVFAYVGIVGGSLFGDTFKVKEAIKSGTRFYLRALGVFIVLSLLLLVPILLTSLLSVMFQSMWVLIALILLVPAFVVAVYWALGIFVLIDRDEGMFRALQGSAAIIRGNWWRTLGYALVLGIIVFAISYIFNTILLYLGLLLFSIIFANYLTAFLITGIGWTILMQLVSVMVIVPLSILYLKNYYQALR